MTVRIKGKYLKPIEDYVDTLVFEDWLEIFENDSYEHLNDVVLKLHPFLDGGSVFSIIFPELSNFFREHEEGHGGLSDPSNRELRADLVTRLATAIERYPRKYEFCIETPGVPFFGDAVVQISEKISWVSGSHVFEEPSRSMLAGALMAYASKTPKQCTFLQIKVEGYGDGSADSPATAEAIALAKQVTFVLVACGALVTSYDTRNSRSSLTPTDAPDKPLVVSLPDSLARGIGKLVPNEKRLITYDKSDTNGKLYTLLGSPGRPAATDGEKFNAFIGQFDLVKQYFSKSVHTDFESISSAIEWYEDSVFSDNQTFAYLAACIGLEALLGDSGHMDEMTRRLCDRYSFLMGKGSNDRNRLSQQYKEILTLRGTLVHAKKRRLAREDVPKLWLVQDMLLQTLWRELQQMIRDSST